MARSGLGLKKTLLLNFIPGGLSYIGFIIGALLDDYSESADTYVFAISSGMYLYVFLGTLVSFFFTWRKGQSYRTTQLAIFGHILC